MKNIAFLSFLLLPYVGLSQPGLIASNNTPPAAQPSGNTNASYAVSTQVNNPLFFNYNSVDELLQPKVITNAFELKMKPQQSICHVYAQIDFHGKKRLVPAGWISLKLLNKTSFSAVASSDAVPLSDYPALLFTQPPTNDNVASYSFSYNVILNALNTHVRSDNYDFSIMFTMTQQ